MCIFPKLRIKWEHSQDLIRWSSGSPHHWHRRLQRLGTPVKRLLGGLIAGNWKMKHTRPKAHGVLAGGTAPLDHFPTLRSRNAEEVRAYLRTQQFDVEIPVRDAGQVDT